MTKPPKPFRFSQQHALESPQALGDDPRPLQVAFGALFDQAANAVYLAGLDLDQVIVDRILVCRSRQGIEREVSAEFLSDAALLEQSVDQRLRVSGDRADGALIVAVRVVVQHDEMT